MQQLLKIIPFLLTLILSAACKGDRQADELTAKAQLLIDTQPDSALIILDDIREKKGTWNKSQQMRYELVYAQAQNKAFVNFTTDSIVLLVADYYKHHGSSNDRMMAYYMTGCAYRDMGDAPSALKYMNLAVDAVDENDKDCDLKTLMHIHSQMGGLYQDVGAFKNEHIEDSHAERLAWQIGDTVSALHLMWTRACSLYDARQPQKAISIIDSIKDFTKTFHLTEEPAITYPLKIDWFLDNKNLRMADSLIHEYEESLGITPQTPDEKIKYITYFKTKGQYYNLKEHADSAILMFHRLSNILKSRTLSQTATNGLNEEAFRGLMDAYHIKQSPDSVVKYAYLYCKLNDSTTISRPSEQLLRMQSLYNYTKIQEKATKSELDAFRLRITIFLLSLLFLICCSFAWMIHMKRIHNERQEQININKRYHLLLGDMERSTREYQIAQNNSELFLREKEKEIEKLQNELSSYQANLSDIEQWSKERTVLSYDIIKRLHTIASHGSKATHNELESLIDLSENKFPKFYTTITDKQSGLTHFEQTVCVLIRFRFIPSELAVLTGHSSQSITNTKAKINKKLFGKQGAKTLETHLVILK